MTTVANISINDAQATPVAHVFVPLFQQDGVWVYEDQTGDSAIGYNKIMLSMTRPGIANAGDNAAKRMVRIKASVYTPVLETLSNSTVSGIIPAPTVAYVCRVNVEYLLPERSIELDRMNIRAYLNGLLNNYQLTNMVDDFIGLTG